ncbi:MAG: PilZ domain-containing protein [Candidatus Omnitrophota bacterium]
MGFRRFSRIPFIRSVRIKAGSDQMFLGYAAKDISTGGLKIISFIFFPVNQWLNLQFQLVDSDVLLEVRGRVAWVRINSVAETYQLGIDFSEEALYKREVIRGFVDAS